MALTYEDLFRKQVASAGAERKAKASRAEKRASFLLDRGKVSREVSARVGSLLHPKKKLKTSAFAGVKYLQVDAAFDEADPMRGAAEESMSLVQKLSQASDLGDMDPREVIDTAVSAVIRKRSPAALDYKFREESAFLGGKKVGERPGYEEFVEHRRRQQIEKVGESDPFAGLTPAGMTKNLAIAAAGNVAMEGVGQALLKQGVSSKAKTVGGWLAKKGLFALKATAAARKGIAVGGLALGPATGGGSILTAGLALAAMTAAEWALYDIVDDFIEHSDWGVSKQDDIFKPAVASIVAGGGSFYAMRSLLKTGDKQIAKYVVQKADLKASEALIKDNPLMESVAHYNKTLGDLQKTKGLAQDKITGWEKANSKRYNYLEQKEAYVKEFGEYVPNVDRTGQSLAYADTLTKAYAPDLPPIQKGRIPNIPALVADVGGAERYVADTVAKRTITNPNMLPMVIEESVGKTMTPEARMYTVKHLEENASTAVALKSADTDVSAGMLEEIIAKNGAASSAKSTAYAKRNPGLKEGEVGSEVKRGSYGLKTTEGQGRSSKQMAAGIDGAAWQELGKAAKAGNSLDFAIAAIRDNYNTRIAHESLKKSAQTLGNVSRELQNLDKKLSKGTKMLTMPEAYEKIDTSGMSARRITEAKKQVGKGITDSDAAIAEGVVNNALKYAKKLKMGKVTESTKLPEVQLSPYGSQADDLTSLLDDGFEDGDDLFDAGDLTKYTKYALTLLPLATLNFTPDNANAGIGSTTANVVEAVAKSTLKSSDNLIKSIVETNAVGIKGEIAGKVERWMKGFSIASSDMRVKNPSALKTLGLRYLVSPHVWFDFAYNKGANPMVELAGRMASWTENSFMHRTAVREILEGVPDFTSSPSDVRKMMAPLEAKYRIPLVKAGYHAGEIQGLKKSIEKFAKKKNVSAEDKITHDLVAKQFSKQEEAFKLNAVDLNDYAKEYEQAIKPLAAKYSGSRIALALDDTVDFQKNPWLKDLVTSEELAAVGRLRELHAQTGARIQAVGGQIMKKDPYAHHAFHPDMDRKAVKAAMGSMTEQVNTGLAMAKIHSRGVGSKMMMPDIEYTMERYIPDIEKRIELMDFWKKDTKDGWFHHMNQKAGLTPELDDMWRRLRESFMPWDDTIGTRLARRYQSFEVFRLLWGSPSVAFKHLMKQTGEIATFPLQTWMKGIKGATKALPGMTKEHLKEDIGEFVPAMRGLKLTHTDRSKLVSSWAKQHSYNSMLADMEFGTAPVGYIDRVLGNVNEVGSFLVGSVENFDRATTIIAGLEMAAKRGMTPAQAQYAVFDSILKSNFLSGIQNPKWLRDPYVRSFMLFQGTPFKIMEQRVVRAAKFGKTLKFTYDELKNFKMHMKEGETRTKLGIIKDALMADKDIYGTSTTRQFMVNMLTLGGVTWAGDKFFDLDIHAHMVHAPFVKAGRSSLSVNLNPILSSGYETWHRKHEEDSDLMFTEFMNTWLGDGPLGTGVVPITFKKALRLSNDDIPEIYQDSKWQYFFGVPSRVEKD